MRRVNASICRPAPCARYGVSAMTIHRWLHNPAVAFPKPLKINSRNYWRMADLEAWEGRQAA
jgi:predicted DNA-binding transcriptional regulator AlpA